MIEEFHKYTEKKSKKKFDDEMKDTSVIEKLFYITIQKKITCQKPPNEENFKYCNW